MGGVVMFEFAHPWMFLALLLPFGAYWLLPPYKERRASVRVPFFDRLVGISAQTPQDGVAMPARKWPQKVILGAGWGLLVAALAQPIWVGTPVVQEKTARDLMIAVDLSGSMETKDFLPVRRQNEAGEDTPISRLEGAKRVLGTFAKTRAGDRLGLIVFGSAPYLQAPFTADLKTWTTLLSETEVAMAGPKTRFGDAIGLAIKLFKGSASAHKVLIVVTDGNDTDSKVPPLEAARIARAHGIRIYAIAIGSVESVGQEALDLEVLAQIAYLTDGQAYLAMNQAELADVYRQIEALEPAEYETISFAPRRELFAYFLGASILLNAFFFSLMLMWSLWHRRHLKKERADV